MHAQVPISKNTLSHITSLAPYLSPNTESIPFSLSHTHPSPYLPNPQKKTKRFAAPPCRNKKGTRVIHHSHQRIIRLTLSYEIDETCIAHARQSKAKRHHSLTTTHTHTHTNTTECGIGSRGRYTLARARPQRMYVRAPPHIAKADMTRDDSSQRGKESAAWRIQHVIRHHHHHH
ncbi:hypothetical protein DM02DRAFT_305418 [Periconia macrospinosa]|uniref:Uncharacterized protein n=1 Tax=Periconia macrospinosa TaxID=97972 RepID=A0A2V1D1W7_9PLEO|nr:hypothetical protein DM02DRAFT_305418 [Periconia macrospinosa]